MGVANLKWCLFVSGCAQRFVCLVSKARKPAVPEREAGRQDKNCVPLVRVSNEREMKPPRRPNEMMIDETSNWYETYLSSEEWRAKALLAKRIARFKCEVCNGRGKLACHHFNYKNLGSETPSDVFCLCWECHQKYHRKWGENPLPAEPKLRSERLGHLRQVIGTVPMHESKPRVRRYKGWKQHGRCWVFGEVKPELLALLENFCDDPAMPWGYIRFRNALKGRLGSLASGVLVGIRAKRPTKLARRRVEASGKPGVIVCRQLELTECGD